MFGEIGDCGYLRVSSSEDRDTVATILYRNGYTVSTKRRKKNGKTYEYYIYYEVNSQEIKED